MAIVCGRPQRTFFLGGICVVSYAFTVFTRRNQITMASKDELALSSTVTSSVSSAYLRNLLENGGKSEHMQRAKNVNAIHHNYWWSGSHNNSVHQHGLNLSGRNPSAEAKFEV